MEPVCEVTEYPVRQLRLLNAREYRATVRDLLPQVDGACMADSDCNVTDQSCVADVCVADPCSLHTFVLPAASPLGTTLHVAGDFNGWAGTLADGGLAMTYAPEEGLYYAKASLVDGTHHYKYVRDEQDWFADPSNPQTTPDGFGGDNSVLVQQCEGAAPPGDGSLDLAADFPVRARSQHYPFDNDATQGLVTSVHVEQFLDAGRQIAARSTSSLTDLLGCAPSADCIQGWVAEFGRRAYRRPLSAEEQSRMVGLATGFSDVQVGVSVALQVFLSSPSFLYRSEMGEADGEGFRLTQYELASLLSYTYLGTTPDDLLLDKAAAGELATPEQLMAEAQRLLADPRARELLQTFAVQWLGVDSVLTTDKSTALHPEMTPALRAQMLEETARLFAHVAFDGTGTYGELLTASYTFAPPELAAHYGIEAGDAVLLADGRAGVLGHGSVLATYAHSDQSSPVRRGLFVRERLLCEEFGAPPPDAGGVPDVDPDATTRERFDQHGSDPACSGCHQYIDPVGFGFEAFDAAGAHRTTENGVGIDDSGTLPDVEGRGTGTSHDFNTLAGLGAALAASDAAPACFSRQWMRYTNGRLEGSEGQCVVDNLAAGMAEDGGDLLRVLIRFAGSPAFSRRSAE